MCMLWMAEPSFLSWMVTVAPDLTVSSFGANELSRMTTSGPPGLGEPPGEADGEGSTICSSSPPLTAPKASTKVTARAAMRKPIIASATGSFVRSSFMQQPPDSPIKSKARVRRQRRFVTTLVLYSKWWCYDEGISRFDDARQAGTAGGDGARTEGPPRPGGVPPGAPRGVRPGGPAPLRLRQPPATHRLRPDHLAAIDCRSDDRGTPAPGKRVRPGSGHRLRLPVRDPFTA